MLSFKNVPQDVQSWMSNFVPGMRPRKSRRRKLLKIGAIVAAIGVTIGAGIGGRKAISH